MDVFLGAWIFIVAIFSVGVLVGCEFSKPVPGEQPLKTDVLVAPLGSVLFHVQGLRSIAVNERGEVTLTADALILNGSIDPEGGSVAGNSLPNDGLPEELPAGCTVDIEHR